MTPKESRDLRQLSELFKDLVSIARSHTSQELDGAAAEWLKGARISIMKHLEESYNELSASATDPLLVPYWAIDSSTPLCLYTPHHPRTLDSYNGVFLREIRKLMEDCGLDSNIKKVSGDRNTFYSIHIWFPSEMSSSELSEKESALRDSFERLNLQQRFILHIAEDAKKLESDSD